VEKEGRGKEKGDEGGKGGEEGKGEKGRESWPYTHISLGGWCNVLNSVQFSDVQLKQLVVWRVQRVCFCTSVTASRTST